MQNYQTEMADLQQRGITETQNLVKKGSDVYQKKYRNIRLQDKSIDFNAKGDMVQKSQQGISFFELKPEYFLPNQGGYDIKFAAGSTLPISESLMQSKATEMYDRLIQLALAGVGYDPMKLGDLLLKVNHFSPSDFHSQKQAQGQQEDTARIQMSIDLASTENNLMMQGKQVPPTPYASAIHTKVHVAFTGSSQFQALSKDDPKVQIMLDHITGELAAQQQRGGQDPNQPPAEGAPGQGQPAPAQGQMPPNQASQQPSSNTMGNIIPAQVTGGGQTPPGV
jgi:hypothetical protein